MLPQVVVVFAASTDTASCITDIQVACFLRDEERIREASGTIAAEIRHHFRTAVKAELQLSLAALPWPASPPRESNTSWDYLHVRADVALRASIPLSHVSQGRSITKTH